MPSAVKKREESVPKQSVAPSQPRETQKILAYGIVRADEPGDLFHLTKFWIEGDRVIKVEKDTATLKVIVAEQIAHHLAMPQ